MRVKSSIMTAVTYMSLLKILSPVCVHAQEGIISIPKSNRVVFGELTLPDKSKVRFAVRDGTWVTVEDRKAQYFFGFDGIINDQTGNPNFVPYKLERAISGSDVEVTELDQSSAKDFTSSDFAAPSRDIRIGQTVSFASAKGIKLKVVGVGEWVFAAPYVTDISQYSMEKLEQEFGSAGNGLCCVTCQGRTVCASSVGTSCGGCGGGGGGGGGYMPM